MNLRRNYSMKTLSSSCSHTSSRLFNKKSQFVFCRLTIGTHSSNVLEYVYAIRSVDDPAASERTLSLDSYFYPVIRKRTAFFRIVSPNFLFNVPNHRNKSPQKLSVVREETKESNIVHVISPRLIPTDGFLKVVFVDNIIIRGEFLTPYYNLEKIVDTF